MPAGTRIETTYRNTEVTPVAPGVASVLTDFETKVVSPGTSYAFGGGITMLLVKQAGRWRIVRGHASSPRPRGAT